MTQRKLIAMPAEPFDPVDLDVPRVVHVELPDDNLDAQVDEDEPLSADGEDGTEI